MINKVIFTLLAISFGGYIKVFDFENVSTILVFIPISLVFLCNSKHFLNVCVDKSGVRVSEVFLLLLIFYFMANNLFSENIATTGIFWWIICVPMLVFSRMKINFKYEYEYELNWFVVCAMVVLAIDAIYRFMLSQYNFSAGFYSYKYGLVGVDSNFSGIFSLLCFSTYDVLSKTRRIVKNIVLLLLSIFVILSLSRAAIFALFLYLYYFGTGFNMKVTTLVLVLSLLLLSQFDNDLGAISVIFKDESGDSKLSLLQSYSGFFMSSDIFHVFFGNGFGKVMINDLNPHILGLQLIIGYGLVGMFLYFSFFAALMFEYNRMFRVLFPYLIVSFSVAPIGLGVLTYVIYLVARGENGSRRVLC